MKGLRLFVVGLLAVGSVASVGVGSAVGAAAPATRPVKVAPLPKAADLDGRYVGSRLLSRSYDPKSREWSFTFAFGNKSNKDVVGLAAMVSLPGRWAGGGRYNGLDVKVTDAVKVGGVWSQTFTVSVPVGDDAAETSANDHLAKSYTPRFLLSRVDYADGTSKDVSR